MPQNRIAELTDLSVVGVDIGKDTFHLVGFDTAGERILRLKIKRLALPQIFDEVPRCITRNGSLPERTYRQPYAAPDGLRT